jgi:biopolymer transport protein ExbD
MVSLAQPDDRAVRRPRRRKASVRRAGGVRMSLNLAPMIDVTFLLLIFFLLTTTFQRAEGVLGANLPKDRGAAAVALPISPIIVRVGTTGPSVIDYRIQIDNFASQPTTFSELSDFLVAIRENEGFDEETPVVLVIEPDAPWDLAVDAWNASVRARCANIAFGGQGG